MHGHVQADVEGLPEALAGKAGVAHDHDFVYRRRHTRVILVASDGTGDFTDPVAATASITDSSETSRYLVKVLPGVYEVTAPVQLPAFVDLEGSGRAVTRIRRTGGTDALDSVVLGRVGSEIRDLTVEGIETPCVVGGDAFGEVGPVFRLSRVAVIASSTALVTAAGICASYRPLQLDDVSVDMNSTSPGYAIGISLNHAYAGMRSIFRNVRVAITSSSFGWGLQLGFVDLDIDGTNVNVQGLQARGLSAYNTPAKRSKIRIRNSSFSTPEYALSVQGVDASIEGSVFSSPSYAISLEGTTNLKVANTRIEGPFLSRPSSPPSVVTCFGTYNADFTPYTCQ